MERLRRLHWNERTVPPERARRLIGIRTTSRQSRKIFTGRTSKRAESRSPWRGDQETVRFDGSGRLGDYLRKFGLFYP